jgi:hypothetical protein
VDLRWIRTLVYCSIKIGYYHLNKKPTADQSLEYRLCVSILWLYSHNFATKLNIKDDPMKV